MMDHLCTNVIYQRLNYMKLAGLIMVNKNLWIDHQLQRVKKKRKYRNKFRKKKNFSDLSVMAHLQLR